MARHIELGAWGEELAARHYARNGWEVIDRNWRCNVGATGKRGEIDLIVRKGRQIAIVEVKTRRTTNYGHPLEAVTEAKQRRIRRIANHWRVETGARGPAFRYDVASVVGSRVQIHPGVF